ncbi:MAG: hypothetical protein GWN09_03765 [Gammaproteobacteria bacterium]|nr:hypothetical protein [Gammaproteobacteria bacterium]
MELNWSTLVLEIVNFLILVWILKRFLYKPVLAVVARRREQIQATLEQAQRERKQGEVLQVRYENRLSEWEKEKESARQALQREMDAERSRRLEALKNEFEDERKKARVLAERERQETEQRLESRALELGARFASRLLTRVAGPELDARLIEVALADLADLPDSAQQKLRHAAQATSGPLEITSARALDASQREALEQTVAHLAGETVTCRYREDPDLVAGIRLRLGSFLLYANLRDELKGFVEAAGE